MRHLTMTITRKYFDLILSGEKTTEYRKDIPYYHLRFAAPVATITFHYRQGVYMVCDVDGIDYIDRPAALAQSVFITTPKCFAIRIKRARLARSHRSSRSPA